MDGALVAATSAAATPTIVEHRPGSAAGGSVFGLAGGHILGSADEDSAASVNRRNRGWIALGTLAALAACLLPWWLDTPDAAVQYTGQALTEAGRITGLLAGFVLAVQLVTMSRVGWLERSVGTATLLGWHRELGALLLFLTLSHLALITVGYASAEGRPLLDETFTLMRDYEDMIGAYLATALMVSISLLGVRALRQALPYELWHLLHLSSYAVLLLGYGHAVATGQELASSLFGRVLWALLYAFVIINLIWGRIIEPAMLNIKHRFRIAQVVAEGEGIFSIYIDGVRLDELPASAGQFFRWRFVARGCWWQAHPFSLSAAPNPQWLRLTVKVVGDHTEQLRFLEPGTRVIAEGPSGTFTAAEARRSKALLIAAGSGIAPIRALLEDLPPGAVVIYRARNEEELIFRGELDWLAQQRAAQVWYVLGGRDDPGPRRALSAKGLRELVPDVTRRDVYLCGPAGLIDTVTASLRRLRVPRRQIHLDPFEF